MRQIDWNAVACNSVLSQEITNGHAARMRFSRFKASLLGIEPQRRNRNGANKNKVTKSKKEPKTKKEKVEQLIKPDPNATPGIDQETPGTASPKVKNEAVVKREPERTRSDGLPSPAGMLPVSMPEDQMQFHHNRLLTPCSDTDLFATPHRYTTATPASEMLHTHEQSPFDYVPSGHCHVTPDPVSSPWQPSPSYMHFQPQPFDYSSSPPVFCDHQHTIAHQEGFGIAPSAMMPPDLSHASVKHEEGEAHYC